MDLTSGNWWLSVVVMGLFLNVVGVYVARYLDRKLGALSERWRERAKKQSEREADITGRMIVDAELLEATVEDEMRSRLSAIMILMLAGFLVFLVDRTADVFVTRLGGTMRAYQEFCV